MFRRLRWQWRNRWRPPPAEQRWRVNRQGFKRNGWTEFAVFLIMVAAVAVGYWKFQAFLDRFP